jgi:HAD superfamily hydrolase (TIGR01509 family)
MIRGVVFDMDGTLVLMRLDFDEIRGELGLPRVPLLEAMAEMSPADRARAERVLHEHEDEAARNSELAPGAREVVAWLRERGVRVALLTRNSRRSAEMILERHGLIFDAVRTREDGEFKPSPVPVLALCERMGTPPAETWSVGDYLFDVQAGRAAGCTTVLIVHGDKDPPWTAEADYTVRGMDELRKLMETEGRLG